MDAEEVMARLDALLADVRRGWEEVQVDPTELRPGDIVVRLNDHEESGCHCDVLVTVERKLDEETGQACRECKVLPPGHKMDCSRGRS